MDASIIDSAREAVLLTTRRLHITIPSILAVGEHFALRITAFGPDGLPDSGFDREIVFEESPCVEGLPRSVRFDPAGDGCLVVDGLRATREGVAYVQTLPEASPGRVRSNPAWVHEDPSYRIYWGDLHVHTTFSNCSAWACKSPEFCYAYARDASHLDFAAAADHLRGIASDPKRWPRLQELARAHDAPGAFAPFLAFESSHRRDFGGDNNVYYLGADGPYFWLDREDMAGTGPAVPLQELWDFLDKTGKEYLTIPHHTGRAGKYRDFSDGVYDPQREPLFEIYSGWGSSETQASNYPLRGGNSDRPCYFDDALRQGCRYGVIASSDTHTTMVGAEAPWREPLGLLQLAWHHHHGLAAVRAKELTRASLWQAMWAGNCYATTFDRALLDLSIGDVGMGQSTAVGATDPLRRCRMIEGDFYSTHHSRAQVTLLRNGEPIDRASWSADEPTVRFEDHADLDEVALRDAPHHPAPFVAYRVRVEGGAGQTQWSSPIWLDLA